MRKDQIVKGKRYFEAQEKGEEVIGIVRKHWLIRAIPFIFGPLAITMITSFVFLVFGKDIPFLPNSYISVLKSALIGATLLFGSLYVFSSWLVRYLNVLIITNKHIVDITQNAFFSRKVSTLALDSIEDVSIKKFGIIPNLFDYGDIYIQTAGELPNFHLGRIKNPEAVQKSIMEAKACFKRHIRAKLP